jgi:hypothetical protein
MDYGFAITMILTILTVSFALMGLMLRKMRKKLEEDSSQHKLFLFDVKQVIKGKKR